MKIKRIPRFEDYIPDGKYIIWTKYFAAVFFNKGSFVRVTLDVEKLIRAFKDSRYHITDEILSELEKLDVKVFIDKEGDMVLGIPVKHIKPAIEIKKRDKVLQVLSYLNLIVDFTTYSSEPEFANHSVVKLYKKEEGTQNENHSKI
ncbi:MAG: hypothetical protein C0446_08510 [Chitinophaga sp.]|nr:hypothetical protein [Chitinophaga sp.]